MIDLIIDNLYKGVKHLKQAEWHILEENRALNEFNHASHYLDNIKKLDPVVYNTIIPLYDRLFTQYRELYHKPTSWKPHKKEDDDEDFGWTSMSKK